MSVERSVFEFGRGQVDTQSMGSFVVSRAVMPRSTGIENYTPGLELIESLPVANSIKAALSEAPFRDTDLEIISEFDGAQIVRSGLVHGSRAEIRNKAEDVISDFPEFHDFRIGGADLFAPEQVTSEKRLVGLTFHDPIDGLELAHEVNDVRQQLGLEEEIQVPSIIISDMGSESDAREIVSAINSAMNDEHFFGGDASVLVRLDNAQFVPKPYWRLPSFPKAA